MMKRLPIRGAALLAAPFLFAVAAQAVPIDQPMTGYAGYTINGGAPSIASVNGNGFVPFERSTAYADIFTTASVSAGPVVSNYVSTPGWMDGIAGYDGGYLNGDVTTSLVYTFTVVGPSAVMVPLTVTGGIYLQAGGTGASSGHLYASVSDNYPGSPHYISGDAASASCSEAQQASCNTPFQLHVSMLSGSAGSGLGNVTYIQMQAASSFGGNYYGASFATATVDPLVAIDPGFLAANPGYSLVFADGVTNAIGPVPELPTPALLLAGLGLLGLSGLRQRRKN